VSRYVKYIVLIWEMGKIWHKGLFKSGFERGFSFVNKETKI
jgi:hypothetical protein